MGTKVEIDDDLLKEAMEVFGATPASELIEKELRQSIQYRKAQLRLLEFQGKVDWEGDLDSMRRDR